MRDKYAFHAAADKPADDKDKPGKTADKPGTSLSKALSVSSRSDDARRSLR